MTEWPTTGSATARAARRTAPALNRPRRQAPAEPARPAQGSDRCRAEPAGTSHADQRPAAGRLRRPWPAPGWQPGAGRRMAGSAVVAAPLARAARARQAGGARRPGGSRRATLAAGTGQDRLAALAAAAPIALVSRS